MKLTLKLVVAAMATAGLCSSVLAAGTNHPAVDRALAHLKGVSEASKTADADAFSARDVVVDADGSTHVRFDRSFKGLRVIGGDLVVHADGRGNFRQSSQTLREALSTDTEARQARFREKCDLSFPMIPDGDKAIGRAYGVMGGVSGLLNLAQRQTFLIDPAGNLAWHWKVSNPATHAGQVLEKLAELSRSGPLQSV